MGADTRLRVDYNQAYGVEEAVRAIKAIEAFGIDVAEQPVAAEDCTGMAEAQRRVDIPLMAHEGCFSLRDAITLAELGAIRVVGINSERSGGLSAALKAIDYANIHPVPLVYFDMNLDLHGISSIRGLQEKLRDAAATLSPGEWVIGLQLDDEALQERRLPNRHDLDSAVPDHPVAVLRHDGHTVIANTAAIEACGINANTPDPEGGHIDREPGGFPAGPFRENASSMIKDHLPIPDPKDFLAAARSAFSKLVAQRIPSVGVILQTDEEGPAGEQGAFDLLLMQFLPENIPINVYSVLVASDIDKVEAAIHSQLHQPEVRGGHRIGGLKIYADGTFGSHTAYMSKPFADRKDTRGFLTLPETEICRRMEMAHRIGLQVAIHAIGDAANRVCLELFRRLLDVHPRLGHCHRLEHASLLDQDMVREMARLGIVASVTPAYIFSEKTWLHKRLGQERAKWAHPFRSMIEAGVRLAGASDAPVESTSVLRALQTCVTREGFETQQAISLEQALRMYTTDAAYAQFEEDVKGSIAAGKRADLVALGTDPFAVAPRELGDITVESTIVGGGIIHSRG